MTETKVCNFCGKNSEEVSLLIVSRDNTYICNECIALCNEVVLEHRVAKLVKQFVKEVKEQVDAIYRPEDP